MKSYMKNVLLAIIAAVFPYCVNAAGESRSQAIHAEAGVSYSLPGAKEKNTTTWFYVEASDLADNNMIVAALSGGNYGDVAFFVGNDADADEVFFIGGSTGLPKNPTINKYCNAGSECIYIAVTQDNAGGNVTFSFTTAIPGQTRHNAIKAVEGRNEVNNGQSPVWYSFTAQEEKEFSIVGNTYIGNAVDTLGRINCMDILLASGFRLQAGMTVYFPVNASADAWFTITSSEIRVGYYSDFPLDITAKGSFLVDLPADPTASTTSAAQSERYWTYSASKSGFLMWGTADSEWVSGMWGCMVRDMTAGKTLNTPLTEMKAGMVTYSIPVEAGHDYLIAQTVAHTTARTVTVYTVFNEPQIGDTKDNPVILQLGNKTDLGRKPATTRYYSFTAEKSDTYTATVHAGGQVRATTPKDGSWNIGRDYSNQQMQMHIDDQIELSSGDVLLLEITLTSDIDFHVDGSDSDIPNYYILITGNGEEEPGNVRDGEDLEHAIAAVPGTEYPLLQSNDDDFYVRYFQVSVPAEDTLVVAVAHEPAVISPSCIRIIDGDGQTVSCINTLVDDPFGNGKIGRRYVVEPSSEDRQLYLVVDGVSFLYDGAVWSYSLSGKSLSTAVNLLQESAEGFAKYYRLDGTLVKDIAVPGLYIRRETDNSDGRVIMVR